MHFRASRLEYGRPLGYDGGRDPWQLNLPHSIWQRRGPLPGRAVVCGVMPVALRCASEPTEQLSDDTLVARALAGDEAAFASLAERYKRPVYNLAYRMLGNRADAEDAAQETFVRAYTRLSSYLPGGKFASWLLAITSHWCVDSLRRRRTVSLDAVQASLGWPSGADYPEELAVRAEGRVEVQRWQIGRAHV